MRDNLIICDKCGSDACYTQDLGADYTVKMCYGCGFTTNSLMVKGSDFLKEQIEVLPELYKDLLYKDENGQFWMPSTINIPEQGMVFIEGTNTMNWKWAAAKAILTEDSLIEGATHKMDMKNVKYFSELDFIEALDYIGVFKKS